MKIHDTHTLPKWAQRYIADLEARVKRAEQTIPWTKPGMEWFTILHPDTRAAEDKGRHRKLFMLGEDYAHAVCVIGPMDCVFVGRGKAPALALSAAPPSCSLGDHERERHQGHG